MFIVGRAQATEEKVMSDPLIERVDSLETPDRSAIRKVYDERRITPTIARKDFRCKHRDDCCPEPPEYCYGIWPYVGSEYGGATIMGQRARILFVAMEQGGRKEKDMRCFEQQQQDFRTGALSPRNHTHMWGVSTVMEALGDEKAPEHYSLQFALTNAVKCTKKSKLSNSSLAGTTTMRKNCSSHLAKEIVVLKPHVLVVQGGHPRQTVYRLLKLQGSIHGPFETYGHWEVYGAVYRNHEFVVLGTYHGASRGRQRWPPRLPPLWKSAVDRTREMAVQLLQHHGKET
jgi:hypothetical protein